MSALERGWKSVKFGDIAENVAVRVDPAEAETDVYVGLEHLDPSTIHLRQWGHPPDATGQKLAFKKCDVSFGRCRGYCQGQNRTREIRPSGIVGRLAETWPPWESD
jgi:hypothetical protein